MSIKTAITDKFLSVSPDDTVEDALKALKKAKVETAPVLDDQGRLLGVFSLQALMKNLLPVSVPMNDGITLDITIPAGPGIAKRLNKVHFLSVSAVMERKVNAITSETPVWEAINFLVQYGSPLIVVEYQTGKAIGIMTAQSALDELNRMKDA
jgi:predicted transcriptional regulator